MKRLIKVLVSDDIFKQVVLCHNTHVPYKQLSQETEIKIYDFIIFQNECKEEIIRNYLKKEKKEIFYTSCFSAMTVNKIADSALMTILYESIMWLRGNTYIDKKIIEKQKFSIQQIELEIKLIKEIVRLCMGEIKMEEFLITLSDYAEQKENFLFFSAFDLFYEYGLNFKLTEQKKESLTKIFNAVCEIQNKLKRKKEWKEIWMFSYKIHNEPEFLLQ